VKMRLSANLCFMLFLVLTTSPVWARTHKHPPKPEEVMEPGYVFALAAANHFLHAWQMGDIEHGMVQLSDNIRHSENADRVEQFFSDAKDRSFEIGRGHGHSGRYSFPVVLVGIEGPSITRKVSEVVVIETGKSDWVVDKLP